MSLYTLKNYKHLKFDWNGHYQNGTCWSRFWRDETPQEVLTGLIRVADSSDEAELELALEAQVSMGRFVSIGSHDIRCPFCRDHKYVDWETDGVVVRVVTPCDHPEGIDKVTFELNVPSGKLVVQDDLREWFPVGREFDINKVVGRKDTTLLAAKNGLAHGFVGNSCPGVYKHPDGHYSIGRSPETERWDDDLCEDVPIPENEREPFDGVQCSFVCTDLWWYSIADAEEIQRRAEYLGKPCELPVSMEVKPGVYRFTHYFFPGESPCGAQTFATFEWVRPSEGPSDWIEKDKAYMCEPAQALMQIAKDHPYLSLPEDKQDGVGLTQEELVTLTVNAVDKLLDTRDITWTPNGYPRLEFDGQVESFEIPDSLTGPIHWRHYSTIRSTSLDLAAQGKVSPAFAELFLMVLRSILKHGLWKFGDENAYMRKEREGQVVRAFKLYEGILDHYPGLGDPEMNVWVRTLDDQGRKKWAQGL